MMPPILTIFLVPSKIVEKMKTLTSNCFQNTLNVVSENPLKLLATGFLLQSSLSLFLKPFNDCGYAYYIMVVENDYLSFE